jgi:hypothetical protein
VPVSTTAMCKCSLLSSPFLETCAMSVRTGCGGSGEEREDCLLESDIDFNDPLRCVLPSVEHVIQEVSTTSHMQLEAARVRVDTHQNAGAVLRMYYVDSGH